MKIIIVFMMAWLLIACGGSKEGMSAKDQLQGELFKVARMNGCVECHSIAATVVGPSWKAVAERYKDADLADARNLLIESVKKGSKGKYYTWKGGDGMPPLERRVSEEAIVQLVDFILALR
ncbi:MAG: cytochrome C biogenesis protein CcsA [Gammaproteobacteria bacterium]|nr:cytochrome C biogenesis protein CcsA [Gammaproteobacteria bacterium]